MALPPILVELRASSTEFMAKMKEARTEIAKLETEGSARFDKLARVGKAATLGVALGVAAIGVESVKMAGDFQKETNVLVTAAGESKDSLGLVRKGILDIASSTGSTWQGLTEGMYQVEKAGYRGADGLQVLKAASQGAAEENANLSTVTSAMTSVMASYHLGADQSVQVMNALKTAAGGSKTSMEEFSGSLSTVLPIASAAGLDFAQVGGAIAGLTRHGTSAAEATQELANTIRNLQAPNKQAIKTMDAWGISSTQVALNLGKRGLGGTLEDLVTTISAKMGPSGAVMLDTFKKSTAAGNDMKTMLGAMSPAAQKLANDFLSNTISLKDYRKQVSTLPTDQLVMARQFANLAVKAGGFSDALKSGLPQATTMNDLLKKMLGGSTGLNTALMLTGDNQAYVNEMTKKTAESLHNGSKNVEGWDSTSKLLNVQLARMHQSIERVGITIGTALIPKVQAVIGFFEKHTTTVKVLAGIVGGALVIAIGAYLTALAKMTFETIAKFALQVAAWFGYESAVVAAEVTTSQAFAVMMAEGAAWVVETVSGFLTATIAAVTSFATMAAGAAIWAVEMLAAGAMALLPFLPIIAAVGLVAFAAYELYKHWDQVWGWITDTLSNVWDFIKEHAKLIVGAIFLLFPPLGLLIAAVHQVWIHWSTIWNAIKTVVSVVWGALKTVFGHIVHAGLWYIRTSITVLSTVWRAVWGVISSVVKATWAFLKPIFGFIVSVGIRVIRTELDWLKSAWSTGWGAIKTTVSSVWSFLKPIFDAIASAIHTITGGLSDAVGAAKSIGGAAGGAAGWIGGHLGFHANGTENYEGGPTWVGERGPEIVNLPRGSSITPNIVARGGGHGGNCVHVYLDGQELHGSLQREELRYINRNGRGSAVR